MRAWSESRTVFEFIWISWVNKENNHFGSSTYTNHAKLEWHASWGCGCFRETCPERRLWNRRVMLLGGHRVFGKWWGVMLRGVLIRWVPQYLHTHRLGLNENLSRPCAARHCLCRRAPTEWLTQLSAYLWGGRGFRIHADTYMVMWPREALSLPSSVPVVWTYRPLTWRGWGGESDERRKVWFINLGRAIGMISFIF